MAIIARLQTPEDNAGIREDMDVITSSDAVYVGEKTLTQRRLLVLALLYPK